MRKCMINWISLSFVGLGCFLLGGATGLSLSKDEEDIWAEDAVKLKDYDPFTTNMTMTREEYEDIMSRKSYDNRVNELYRDASPLDMEVIEDTVDHENILNNEEIVNTTPYDIDVDGDTIQVKNTSEGIIQVTEPYIISEDEYIDPNVFSEFERNTLIYYAEDDVLATERDEVVTNVEELIGPDALNSFGYKSVNKDTVFVRNVKLGSNFEIVQIEESYQSAVLGLDDEDEDYNKAKKFFDEMEVELENDNG